MDGPDNFFNFGVQALYVGGAAPYNSFFEGIATQTLQGVQSASISLEFPRVEEFGWDGGGNQIMVERPRAGLAFSYYFTSGINEAAIGLKVGQGVPALGALNDERNYYLLINQAHQDLVGYQGWNNKVLALGNGVINGYSFSAGVGQVTTVNATVEGLNLLVQNSGSGQYLPAILKQTANQWTGTYTLPFATSTIGSYLDAAPGNISLRFDSGCAIGTLLSGNLACPIQNFKFDIAIPRSEVKELGWAYPDTRPVLWPVSINISADAYLNNLQVDALNRFNCNDSGYDFTVGFKNGCGTYDDFNFAFRGAKLESQSFVSQVGGLTRVSFDWSMKIMDINRSYPNFYIFSSGTPYTSIVFPQVEYTTGLAPLEIFFGTTAYVSVLSGPMLFLRNSGYTSDTSAVSVIRIIETGTASTSTITVTVV